jgi:hypothetical protein
VQTHYRYENARRNRVYGKHIPNTRVDTSELADRVSHYHLSGNHSIENGGDRRLASATSFDPVSDETKERKPNNLVAWYIMYQVIIYAANSSRQDDC